VQSLTKADYDAAEARRDSAQARGVTAKNQVEAARAQVGVAESIASEVDLSLLDTSLKAPFDGTLMSRAIEVGSLVGPGTLGFVLADTSSVKAVFGVPDTAVVLLKPGMQIHISLEAIPNVTFSGRITRISPMSDPKSRAFDVEATIPNQQGRLRVGMIATVTIPNPGPPKEAMLLPLKAVIRSPKSPDHYAVMVVEREGENAVAHLRDVQLGAAFGNAIEVIGGLRPGQQVIAEGSSVATDGEPVQIIP
jgi:RND family efflux transporter MFP subunit